MSLKLLKSGEEDVYSSENYIVKVFYYTTDTYDDKRIQKICDISIKLSHLIPQYVPKIYQRFETQQYTALYMEKFDAITLYEYMVKKENYNVTIVCKIVQSLLKAVNSMHKAGYVHGDLNSGNILITKDYNVKLIDFSLVDDVNSISDSDSITPKLHEDYLSLKVHIAALIFPNLPAVNSSDTMNIIKDYTEKDVIGYGNPKAIKLYKILNLFANITC